MYEKIILALGLTSFAFSTSANNGIVLQGNAWEMSLGGNKYIGCSNNPNVVCCTINARVGDGGHIEITIENHNGNNYRLLAAPGHTLQSAEAETIAQLQSTGVEIN